MDYASTVPAIFLSRENRFVARVLLDGREERVHLKNTGRLGELLVPGAAVLLTPGSNPARRTAFDLVTVEKAGRWVNIDSMAANAVAAEYVAAGGLGFVPETLRREVVHGDSRFDFFLKHGGRPMLLEVKGVTLERGGVACFPDAPTERGVKHLRGLIRALDEGFDAGVLFVIQMQGVRCLIPNDETHPAFGDALRAAEAAGVQLLAVDCRVSPGRVEAANRVEVRTAKIGYGKVI